MDVAALYERRALDWIADRGDACEQAWLDRFLALAPQGAAILDLGCGSGEPIAAYFIGKGCAVTGVDASPSLIAHCGRRFPAQAWLVADMRTLALERTFGGLIAWDSTFHLSPDDQRAIFPLFRAHAGERAALMFTSGPGLGEIVGDYHGEPLYHASLNPDEYRALLDANGFVVVAHVVEDKSCGDHTVWLAQLR